MSASLDHSWTGLGVFVGGEWREGGAGSFPVENPATLEVVAHVANGDATDAADAVSAARSATPGWTTYTPRDRAEILRRVFELMHRDLERLAGLIVAENGKSTRDAVAEVAYAADFFRWFSEEAVRAAGNYGSSPGGGTRTIVTHRPVGVAALVTPWNFPAAMAARKIAPALAAGCTCVLKPAAETPLTALAIAGLLQEAELPDGVVNVVPSTDAELIVSTWLNDPAVRKLSFTGSTKVGSILLKQAADRIVNSSMELGGNTPFIVMQDADIEHAVRQAMVAKFRNGGQACTAANRFYIHASVADEFTERFGRAVERLRVGAADSGADVGPVISARALANLEAIVDQALAAGARISHRAVVGPEPGYFYPPTVLVDVPPGADILETEIFGPVAPIVTWTTDDELTELVNASALGLAGYVFAGDLEKALRISEAMEVGMVGINRGSVSDPAAPFGGLKESGLGREGARLGLDEFLETQYFSVDWPQER